MIAPSTQGVEHERFDFRHAVTGSYCHWHRSIFGCMVVSMKNLNDWTIWVYEDARHCGDCEHCYTERESRPWGDTYAYETFRYCDILEGGAKEVCEKAKEYYDDEQSES